MTAHHDLRFKTSLPYERVEYLLTACCTKLYSISLDNVEQTPSGPQKVIRISFEDANDRERFRSTFQRSRDQVPPAFGTTAFTDALPKRSPSAI